MASAAEVPPPPRLSRYRSIKGRNVPESRRPVEPMPTGRSGAGSSNDGESGVIQPQKRPSRSASDSTTPPPVPLLPAIASLERNDQPHSARPRTASASVSATQHTHAAAAAAPPMPSSLDHSPPRPRVIPLRPAGPGNDPSGASPTEKATLHHSGNDGAAQREALEVQRLLAEQKRQDLERLQRQLATHSPTSPPSAAPAKSPVRGKLASFARGLRGHAASSATSSTSAGAHAAPLNSPLSPPVTNPGVPRPSTSHGTKAPAAASGLSPPPLPGTNMTAGPRPSLHVATQHSAAPDSGLKRTVRVRCQQVSMNIPVHQDTTVEDILDTCTEFVRDRADISACALVEYYARLGLERRLRRYERIRDIMNSWDTDSDNELVVVLPGEDNVPPPARGSSGQRNAVAAKTIGRGGHGEDLELASVLRSSKITSSSSSPSPPQGFIFMHMYHSQKLGRWSKRYITIVEETGQLFLSKKADSSRLPSLPSADSGNSNTSNSTTSNSGGSNGFQNLCHLSDYDIYVPLEARLRRQLKPPKTYCFAVKSQQRTTVFVNTDNYVHFFSADDPQVARMFYERVFQWRSWYLVHKKLALLPPLSRGGGGDGGLAAIAAKKGPEAEALPPLPQSATVQSPSSAVSPPLSSSSMLKKTTLQRSASRRSGKQSSSEPPPLFVDGAGKVAGSAELSSSTFAAHGLLGDVYNERKRAEAARQRGGGGVEAPSDPEAHIYRGGPPPLPSGELSTGTAAVVAAAARHDHHVLPTRRGTDATPAAAPTWMPPSEHSAPAPTLQHRPSTRHREQPQLQRESSRENSIDRHRSVRKQGSGGDVLQEHYHHQLPQQHPPLPHMPPAPLIDLTPEVQEAPQWSRAGRGHGVKAPPGTARLVDLATDWNGGRVGEGPPFETPPPARSAFVPRNDPQQPLQHHVPRRALTMTAASARAAADFSRNHHLASRDGEQPPPMPLLSRIPPTPTSPPLRDAVGGSRGRSATMTRYG